VPYTSVNSFVQIGIEGTPGTLSSVLKTIPVSAPQVTPMQTFLRDEAFRGSPTTVYSQVAGVRHDEYDAKFYVYPDTFPLLAYATLGKDTVTGTTPKLHTVKLLNAPTSGSQPPSVSIIDFDGQQAFQMLDAQLGDLKITFGAEAAIEATTKFITQPWSEVSTPGSLSIGANTFVPGWDVALTIGGTSSPVLVDGELNLTRATAPIFTAGTQSPYKTWAGPLDVSGRLKFVVESSDPLLLATNSKIALTQNPKAVVLTFTEPQTTYTTTITMTTVQFHDAKRTRDKAYVEVDANFTALANTTDADSGYAPISIASQNLVSTY
jgi:hypothetical protein